ncbi:DUF7551 domain-containing protein [Haloarchaeobius amylolyticus]|uniref:DUF7551 domain-containing protein n=1 Tax=Haloarchaeobius amylolyticus TaxID=1198296 RepID=UPI00227115AE|nr:hypothetical protein [Haloarchaeobius amylolyticus]
MFGTTLTAIRDHVEALASDDGDYVVVCARTGERPVPTGSMRFETRSLAERAAQAAMQYRTRLRRYDPTLRYHDLIACEARGGAAGTGGRQPPVSAPASTVDRSPLVEFCHHAAGAVFEALGASGLRAAETAVMDEYFDLAETVVDPDELCLCLLERLATVLDARLDPTEQTEVLTAAASRLPAGGHDDSGIDDDPVTQTLSSLQNRGMLSQYSVVDPATVDQMNGRLEGEQPTVVRIADYALSPQQGRLPVLPLVLDISRRRPEHTPSSVRAVAVDGAWQLRFTPPGAAARTGARSTDDDPGGIVSAPIEEVS